MYNNSPKQPPSDQVLKALQQQHAALRASSGCISTAACNDKVEPKQSEIPEALKRAFSLSDEMSAGLAELNARLRPVSQCAPPSEATNMAEARTEVGSAIAQLNARMNEMLGTIQSMTYRLEI